MCGGSGIWIWIDESVEASDQTPATLVPSNENNYLFLTYFLLITRE